MSDAEIVRMLSLYGIEIPDVSIMSALGIVVEKMRERGWMPEFEGVRPLSTDAYAWRARFRKWGSALSFHEQRASLPRAICIAAIAALEER